MLVFDRSKKKEARNFTVVTITNSWRNLQTKKSNFTINGEEEK